MKYQKDGGKHSEKIQYNNKIEVNNLQIFNKSDILSRKSAFYR